MNTTNDLLKEPLLYRLLGLIITSSNINGDTIKVKFKKRLPFVVFTNICQLIGLDFKVTGECSALLRSCMLARLIDTILRSNGDIDSIITLLKLGISSSPKTRYLIQGLAEATGSISCNSLSFNTPEALVDLVLHYLRLDGIEDVHVIDSKNGELIKLSSAKAIGRFISLYTPLLPNALTLLRYDDSSNLRYWLLGFSLVRAVLKDNNHIIRYYVASTSLADKLLRALAIFNTSTSISIRIEVSSNDLYEWISKFINYITEDLSTISNTLSDKEIKYLLKGISDALLNDGNHLFRKNLFVLGAIKKLLEIRMGRSLDNINELILLVSSLGG